MEQVMNVGKLQTVRDWFATIRPPRDVQLQSAWLADHVDYCDKAAKCWGGAERWSVVKVAKAADDGFRPLVRHDGKIIERGYVTPGKIAAVQAAVVGELERIIAGVGLGTAVTSINHCEDRP